jgi:hypothetical protein
MGAAIDDRCADAVGRGASQRILACRIVDRDETRLRLGCHVVLILRNLMLAYAEKSREHGRYDCKWHG